MTNNSSFDLENIEHAHHYAVGTWLSNFCHCFCNPFGTFN